MKRLAPLNFAIPVAVCLAFVLQNLIAAAEPWARHTIDASSRGADGARVADVNGDGLLDIATPWEEGGVVRVYLHPGHKHVREPWPAVSVGRVADPEDAVFVDLDRDGAMDVVTSCEGDERTVYVHWAPSAESAYNDADAWRTEALPRSRGMMQWMYCLPADVDGDGDADLVMGAKNDNAQVGFFICPDNPRDLKTWRWRPVYDAGWIMSIEHQDVDADGVMDILVSDRKGASRGVLWLSKKIDSDVWEVNRIGPVGQAEVMFLWGGRYENGGPFHVIVGAKEERQLFHFTQTPRRDAWDVMTADAPSILGTPKSVSVADLNHDGRREVVLSCEPVENKLGLVALDLDTFELQWEIADTTGNKFDRVELLDLDGDGDLDVLTCEEREGLGVVWYENPHF